MHLLILSLLASPLAAPAPVQSPEKLAATYVDAVRELNESHARKPLASSEDELAAKLPAKAKQALEKLLAARPSPELGEALGACGEAALDLARVQDFEQLRARLEQVEAARAQELGTALARPRFLLRGMGGLDTAYLERFAATLDGVLDAYSEVFGFREWSKVPGKRLRVRVHLEPKIVQPPHFAPQFPFHSEIDFPVIDRERLRSPTEDGKFLFYGLCHELGHVIAMWGDTSREEDHHAWAHYTGVAIVEHLAASPEPPAWLDELRDARWRSLARERERLAQLAPGRADRDAVLALLIGLHDRVGPKALGDAINRLDSADRRLRVNHVRYYTFKELREALLEGAKSPEAKDAVQELLR